MYKLTLSHIAVVMLAIFGVFALNLAVVSGQLSFPGYDIGREIGKESIGRQARAFAVAFSGEEASQPGLLTDQFRRFVAIAYIGNSSLSTGHILVVNRDGVLIDQVNSTLPLGAPINEPEAPEMAQIARNAVAGETDLASARLYAFHSETGVYMGAYPIMDGRQRPVGAILLRTAKQEPFPALLWHSLPAYIGTSPMPAALTWGPVVAAAVVVSFLLAHNFTRRCDDCSAPPAPWRQVISISTCPSPARMRSVNSRSSSIRWRRRCATGSRSSAPS